MIKIYKCPGCGFNLIYSGSAKKMTCSHCGREAAVEEVQANEAMGQNVMQGPEEIDTAGTGVTELRCPSCGVSLFTSGDTHTAATVCPACGQAALIESRVEGAFRPKYVIPFTMDKKQAKEAFKAWSKKGRLTPSSFRTEATLDKMKGIYVPAWFFTYTVNMALRLDAEKRSVKKSGNAEITTVENYTVALKTNATYERVPYNADETVPNEAMQILEPYDYTALTEFALPYLSGFFAERYHFNADELSERVKASLQEDLEELSKAELTGYDQMTVTDRDTEFTDENVEYVLLPVWMLQYEYGRKKFPIYMNGQTGKIDGTLPVSKGKVLLVFAIVFAVVLLALIILGRVC